MAKQLSEQAAKSILDTIPKCMRSIRAEMRALAKADLSVPQFRMMVKLAQGKHTNKEISEWMGVSTPTTSRMLDGLVRKGFVARVESKKDRREVSLCLTKLGIAKHHKIKSVVQDKISAQLEQLSKKDTEQLIQGLIILGDVFP